MNMKKTAAFLILLILLTLSACSQTQTNNLPADTSPSTTAAEPESTESEKAKTDAPVLFGKAFIGAESYCIVGGAPDGAEISVTGGDIPVTARTVDGQFTAEIPVSSSKTGKIELSVYAKGENMLRSDALTVTIGENEPRKTDEKIMYVGKNNRLFYYDSLPDYMGTALYTEPQLERIKEKFESLQAKLADAGLNTQVILYIAPNPGTIYPEDMPDSIVRQKISDNSRLSQLIQFFEENPSTIKFITSVDSLLAAKDEGIETYYKTDTHWNEYGAYYGYCDIFNYISQSFPAAKPYGPDMLDIYSVNVKPGWLIEPVVGKQNSGYIERVTNVRIKPELRKGFPIPDDEIMYAYNESYYQLKQYKTDDSEKPDILVYRDSYSVAMMSFLSESSNISTLYTMWDYTINLDYITKLAPDYVIIERVERYIADLPYMIK